VTRPIASMTIDRVILVRCDALPAAYDATPWEVHLDPRERLTHPFSPPRGFAERRGPERIRCLPRNIAMA
jgi:hypothetical protein